MKKLFAPLLCAALALTSCEQFETVTEVDRYDNVVSCSVDTITGATNATSEASIVVKTDAADASFIVDILNLQLTQDAAQLAATVTGLHQYSQMPQGSSADFSIPGNLYAQVDNGAAHSHQSAKIYLQRVPDATDRYDLHLSEIYVKDIGTITDLVIANVMAETKNGNINFKGEQNGIDFTMGVALNVSVTGSIYVDNNAYFYLDVTFDDYGQVNFAAKTMKLTFVGTKEVFTPAYCYMAQKGSAGTAGSLAVTNMRYGFLSNTFWCGFTSGSHVVWLTPQERKLYAVRNEVVSPTGSALESSINPSYTFTLNTEQSTVSIKGVAVKFPQSNTDTNETLDFRTFELNDVPVIFTKQGYTLAAESIVPVINGEANSDHVITGLTGVIGYDYLSDHNLKYTMRNQHGQNITIHTTLSPVPNN